ncbi:hypothetical protein [Maribacter sp. 2307ULW6-5]|uniref:hypothetical protein n=1 Tax=Maribacter sp. 2307ULW6-5 TaxID=3386275 RepID=UPI0039BD2EED
MEKNLRVDKSYIEAFNLGYEVAKELDLKTPMFQNESSNITLKSPMQAGMFQFVQDRQAVLDKRIGKSKKALKTNTIKKTFGKNRNRGKGLTP